MLKNEYELLIKFDEHTYNLFGLYQQAVVGDINVPSIKWITSIQKKRHGCGDGLRAIENGTLGTNAKVRLM
uniref:Uncharacterized protein n=1 Tax=Parascaris equorum TaxID=6256 RepID=A0A914RQ60_PAREQ